MSFDKKSLRVEITLHLGCNLHCSTGSLSPLELCCYLTKDIRGAPRCKVLFIIFKREFLMLHGNFSPFSPTMGKLETSSYGQMQKLFYIE